MCIAPFCKSDVNDTGIDGTVNYMRQPDNDEQEFELKLHQGNLVI